MLSNFLKSKNYEIAFNGMVEETIMRRLCFTENGYMGLVPEETQVGDEIWLLKGCRVPLVLRSRAIGGGYELMGDSLIHGIMYGEGYDEKRCVKVDIF